MKLTSAVGEFPIRLTLDAEEDREIVAELDAGEPGRLFTDALREVAPAVRNYELTRESRDNGKTWDVRLLDRTA